MTDNWDYISSKEIVSGVISGVISGLIVYVLLSTGVSPLTSTDLEVGPITVVDDVLQVPLENNGNEPIGNVNIVVRSDQVDYNESQSLRLGKQDQERVPFDGLKATYSDRSTGFEEWIYEVNNFSQATSICQQLSPGESTSVSTDILNITLKVDMIRVKESTPYYILIMTGDLESSHSFQQNFPEEDRVVERFSDFRNVPPRIVKTSNNCLTREDAAGQFKISRFENDSVKRLYNP